MRKAVLVGFLFSLLVVAFWTGAFYLSILLGFDNQVTHQYGFTSGVGPMLLTAITSGTIIGSLWHTVNCHESGCWNIGRHKVNGTPWCNDHHDNARHEKTAEQLLSEILEELKKR